MLKRIMACLLAIACLLTALAFAEGVTMKVINVNEAVNLRKGPSTDTQSLALVPLGTVLTDCEKVDGSEWISVNYNGITGYIRGDKLQVVEDQLVAEGTPLKPVAEDTPAPVLQGNVDAPVASVTDATDYNDDFTILDEQVGDVRVVGRQIYQEDHEYLMVVGLDANGKELWKQETTTNHITELQQTEVFMGGTKDAPLVLIYNASYGLAAVDPATGEQVWELPRATIRLGGSISHVVDSNGIAYIGGYYGPDPVAIDAKGNVLWEADSGNEAATWLYSMELREDGIACLYGSMVGENTGTIVYDFNGKVKDVVYD